MKREGIHIWVGTHYGMVVNDLRLPVGAGEGKVLVSNDQGDASWQPVSNVDHYTHDQVVASDTWVIHHNLGKHPSVTCVDSAGTVFYPSVEYINENTCIARLKGAASGKAFCN